MSPYPGSTRFIYADELIGRRVVDDHGEPAGRIQELRIEKRGSEWLVVAYVLGLGGLRHGTQDAPVRRILGMAGPDE